MKFSTKYHRVKLKHIKKGADPHRDAFISDCGLFAVHKDFQGSWWTLTHLPTGHAFGVNIFESPKKARDFAKEIKPLLDWSKLTVKVTQKLGTRKTETIVPDGVDFQSIAARIREIRAKYL